MSQIGDMWYRYEDVRYAPMMNEYDERVGSGRMVVELRTYIVTRVTPKGVRIGMPYFVFGGCSRLVLHASRKKYACPTKAEALESFRRRKIRQISILKAQLNRAQDALSAIDYVVVAA